MICLFSLLPGKHIPNTLLHMLGGHLSISQVTALSGPLCHAVTLSISTGMASPISLTCHRD